MNIKFTPTCTLSKDKEFRFCHSERSEESSLLLSLISAPLNEMYKFILRSRSEQNRFFTPLRSVQNDIYILTSSKKKNKFNLIFCILIGIIIPICIYSQDYSKSRVLNEIIISDTLNPKPTPQDMLPIIILKPDTISISKPKDSKFITTEIKVLNRGGAPLIISRVNASCKCASGKVLDIEIPPMTIGKIILSINLDGLYDNNNMFVFTVESNAKNSPSLIKVKIIE